MPTKGKDTYSKIVSEFPECGKERNKRAREKLIAYDFIEAVSKEQHFTKYVLPKNDPPDVILSTKCGLDIGLELTGLTYPFQEIGVSWEKRDWGNDAVIAEFSRIVQKKNAALKHWNVGSLNEEVFHQRWLLFHNDCYGLTLKNLPKSFNALARRSDFDRVILMVPYRPVQSDGSTPRRLIDLKSCEIEP
ncbi:hypothetical protein [Oceanicaulis alexandrii]|uniref:hypothetical protein n=1 Tax=Oceanicaulis alexandrii TaxID=153233 RepID=UPI003B505FB2